MTGLRDTVGYTVAPFAQAVGAVRYANDGHRLARDRRTAPRPASIRWPGLRIRPPFATSRWRLIYSPAQTVRRRPVPSAIHAQYGRSEGVRERA
jgi:hypothetical protein